MAKMRKKAWLQRALGVTLAAVLAVQPVWTPLSSVSVVHAAELTELVANGNFSDISEDGSTATNWELRKEGTTEAHFENGKAVFNIKTMGADWANYLKYTPGIDLKNGQNYEISFTVNSSVDRTIQYGFDGGRLGIATTAVKAGETAYVNYIFTAPQDYNSNPYMFYLGNIDNVTNPTEEHTVEISAFSIKTTEAANGGETGGDENGGDDNGQTGNETTVSVLENGDFSDVSADGTSAANWMTYGESGTTAEFAGGKALFNIKGIGGVDWSNYLKYTPGVNLKNGQAYEISFTVKSSVARTIQYGFDGPRTGIETRAVNAGEETFVSYTYTAEQDMNANPYVFYLGKIGTDENLPEHTVEISNVSIRTTDGGTSGGTGSGGDQTGGDQTGGETNPPVDADTDDGEPVAAVEGNLLTNGNFENRQEGWEFYSDNADIYWNQYRTVFQIRGDAADWGQALVQNVNLEAGLTYRVSFDIETTVERTVAAGFDNSSSRDEFHSETIPANTRTTLSYQTTNALTGSNKFMIYLGTNVGAHKVVISNVSIVECPAVLPNVENDEAPTALTSLKGLDISDAIALKDGCFTDGLNRWEHWEADWMKTWNVVQYTPAENGMNVYIKNVGDGEGNNAWDVQLNQHIDLKKDLQYTISFDVHTEKARAVNLVIMELGTGDFVKTIGLQQNETRHVVFNIPVQSEDALDKLFSIQMGKVTGDVLENNLTFTNMKIEVNGCEELAVRIKDGDFTDGLGGFTTNTTAAAAITASEGSVQADISVAATAGDVTVSRGGIDLEEGVPYVLSFMAGATSGNRTISVQLPDGTTREFALTDDAALYTAEFTPAGDITSGQLTFLLGGAEDVICLDTVRLDAKGYVEAAGINVTRHDISILTKNAAPVISEAVNAVEGNDIVLTYVDSTGDYSDAITDILIDGVAVPANKYTVEQGKITLDKSLFSVTGERQTFSIQIHAYWYETSRVSQIVYKTKQWELTWADEFNGTSLDMTKWSYQDGTGAEYGLDGWGNNEQQYYTRDNLTVEDGTLTIAATNDSRGGKPYSSARIWTMSEDQQSAKFAQTYGRFEAKIKMPAGEGCQGLWPAFWLLPADSPYGGWPVSGEIDIMEARGRVGNSIDSTLHYGKTYPHEAFDGAKYIWEEDESAIADYHIYSVDWTPTYMSFQVDGVEFYRAENWYCQDDNEPQKFAFPAPFDRDFYIILNMAVGGVFDGNLIPSESALPAEMKVDYVRVYESVPTVADGYIAPDPSVVPDAIDSDAKTELIDPNFTDVKTVISDSDAKNVDGWNLLTLSPYGGAATFGTTEIDGDTFAKINISNVGNQTYSVQLTQKLSLYQGRWYTLSFDAKADAAREIIAKLGGDGTNSWSTYNGSAVKLTKELKHYEYTFQMMNESDPSSRLELNMGTGNATTVYIGNVKFEESDGLVINHDVAKAALESGNQIYNGSFMLGDTSRMAYWHTPNEGGSVVKEGAEYFFRSQKATTLYQTGIELLQSDTYKLTFDAKAATAQELEVIISDADGSSYASGKVAVGPIGEQKKVTFTMPAGVTDKDAVVTFRFAGSGVDIDNIVLNRETYNNVNYEGLNCYPLVNGDFELGTLGWSTYGTTLGIAQENGTNTGRVAGTASTNRWDSLVSYGDLEFVGGYDYELSFDAKADRDAEIDISLENASYSRYFAQTNIAVGTEWQNYTYSFKFSSDALLSLKILTGGAAQDYQLDIDNVVVKIKGAGMQPGSFVPDAYNRIGEDLTLACSGSADWSEKAVILIDGTPVDTEKYSFGGNGLTLDASLFTESREYRISATAEGYADSTPVTLRLYPGNGDLICNGDMAYGNSAWNQYIHGGNSATLKYDKGYLAARYLHAEGDEWNNPSVPWSIQWNQSVTVGQAGSYDISFVAFSEAERYIMVSVAGQSAKVLLTDEPQVHTVTFNIENAGAYEVQFFMGTVNPNAENGYFPAEGFVDFDAHNFYVDCISMLPAGTEADKGGSELFQPIAGDDDQGDDSGEENNQPGDNAGNNGNGDGGQTEANTGNTGTANGGQTESNTGNAGTVNGSQTAGNAGAADTGDGNLRHDDAGKSESTGTGNKNHRVNDQQTASSGGSANDGEEAASVKEEADSGRVEESQKETVSQIADEVAPLSSRAEKSTPVWWGIAFAVLAVTGTAVIFAAKKKVREE